MLQPREFYKEELSGFFFWWGAWWGEEAEPPSNYSLTPVPSPNGEGREYCCLQVKESLPKPLRRRGCIPPKYFFLSKRASLSCEEGVSSLWREPFFTPTKRPLYLQTIVFTPLSITSLRSVTVGSERGWGFFSPAPIRYSSPWGRLGGVIPFGEGMGERLSFICKQ